MRIQTPAQGANGLCGIPGSTCENGLVLAPPIGLPHTKAMLKGQDSTDLKARSRVCWLQLQMLWESQEESSKRCFTLAGRCPWCQEGAGED